MWHQENNCRECTYVNGKIDGSYIEWHGDGIVLQRNYNNKDICACKKL
jgi:antitoxin component YwqK of YwqJK toxin-antitoxin module